MLNRRKVLNTILVTVMGLLVMLLAVQCSNQPITNPADGSTSSYGKKGGTNDNEAIGGEDDTGSNINVRLDLKWGEIEFAVSASGVIANEGGSLTVKKNGNFYTLDIGPTVLATDQGIGLQVTKGKNVFDESVTYVSFTPQNISVYGSFSLTMSHPYYQETHYTIYFWNDSEESWTLYGAVIGWVGETCVRFSANHFGTYAILAIPISQENNDAA